MAVSLPTLATALAVVAVAFLLQQQLVPRPLAGIPRLDGTWPLLGDFVPLFAHYLETKTFHHFFVKHMRAGAGGDRGVYQFFWFGRMRRPMVILADLDETVDILSKRHAEFDRSPRVRDTIATQAAFGMLSIDANDMWRVHRRIVAYSMTVRHIKALTPSVIAMTRSLFRLWEAKLAAGVADSDGIMEVEDDLTCLTTDIISEVVFGTSYHQLDEALYSLARDPSAPKAVSPFEDAGRLAECAKMFVDALPAESPFPAVSQLLYWLSSPTYRAAARYFRRSLEDKIVERRVRVRHGESDPTILDGMLEKEWQEVQAGGKPMRTDEIRDELITILAAGEETTSSVMCWTLHFLAQSPDAQARLHEELRSVLPPRAERELVHDDIIGRPTPYLDAVIHESLRLAQVVTVTYRTALVDTTVLGVPIPSGTDIIALTGFMAITGRGLEHAPDDIEQFRPERWLTPAGEFDPKALPMLPFLAGPRDCVGKRLAMMELYVFAAMLSQSFVLEPLPADLVALGGVSKELITHRPAKGVRVKLVKREAGL